MCADKSVSAFPDGENLFKWVATITGPKDTVSIISDSLSNLGYNLIYCRETWQATLLSDPHASLLKKA